MLRKGQKETRKAVRGREGKERVRTRRGGLRELLLDRASRVEIHGLEREAGTYGLAVAPVVLVSFFVQ